MYRRKELLAIILVQAVVTLVLTSAKPNYGITISAWSHASASTLGDDTTKTARP